MSAVRFTTYAGHWIREAMQGVIARESDFSTVSLDDPVPGEEGTSFAELLADEGRPFERALKDFEANRLLDHPGLLTERERRCLRLRYYGEKTLRQTGESLGLTKTRVHRDRGAGAPQVEASPRVLRDRRGEGPPSQEGFCQSRGEGVMPARTEMKRTWLSLIHVGKTQLNMTDSTTGTSSGSATALRLPGTSPRPGQGPHRALQVPGVSAREKEEDLHLLRSQAAQGEDTENVVYTREPGQLALIRRLREDIRWYTADGFKGWLRRTST
jgi:hypothetical protein